jgi:hypothetical protein
MMYACMQHAANLAQGAPFSVAQMMAWRALPTGACGLCHGL